ncbi:MAG: xanthine dehydrogenase family protein subunit M [Chloroflexi bacterium]|nr:xanthine dehydrogenase family protein subunit M [Chloroflexota bacterium]
MRPFTYAAPQSLQEALDLLAKANGTVRPLVGGTDLIDQLRQRRKTADVVLDIKRIPEMHRLEYVAREGLHVGAAVSCADTAAFAAVRELYPAIRASCLLVGSVQIQNRASIAGNVCNSAPSADTVPPLVTLDARAAIVGPRGRREVPLEEFFTGPGQNVLRGDELLLEIVVPPPAPHSSNHYLRFIPRNEMDIAVAGVSSLVALRPRGRICARARIALAAVAPTPVRAKAAEAVLEGHVVTSELIEAAAEKAVEACRPITDVRGSAEYRKELVKVLTRRTLRHCMASLGQPLES